MDSSRPLVKVVAGVVLDRQGRYLLSSRPEGKPYAGYWEFAGGKLEAGETEFQALQRELEEELGIFIRRARPWLTKIYDYEHARVHLRFFRVEADEWSGEPESREGQAWSWQRAGDFNVSPMLPANGPILAALAVPTVLTGRLKTGFYGENSMGGYRVVPFELAEPQHKHVLIEAEVLRRRGKMPQADSVWVLVSQPQQWPQVQDADVVVWRVQSEDSAAALAEILAEGTDMPLVVLADGQRVRQCRAAWLAHGAHAVLIDEESEWA